MRICQLLSRTTSVELLVDIATGQFLWPIAAGGYDC